MAVTSKIVTVLEAQHGAFTKSVDESNKSLASFGAHAKNAGKDVDSLKSRLEDLKGSFGRGSTLGELGHLLEGAGAVAGITLLGRGLEEMTGKAAELVDQFSKGEITGGQMVQQIAEGIPVVGNFVKVGENIAEMFTHSKAKAEALNEEIKRTTDELKAERAEMDAMAARLSAGTRGQIDLQRRLMEMQSNAKIEAATTPEEKGAAQREAALGKTLDDIYNARQKAVDDLDAKHQKAIEAIEKAGGDERLQKIDAENDAYADQLKTINEIADALNARAGTDEEVADIKAGVIAFTDGYAKYAEMVAKTEDQRKKQLEDNARLFDKVQEQQGKIELKPDKSALADQKSNYDLGRQNTITEVNRLGQLPDRNDIKPETAAKEQRQQLIDLAQQQLQIIRTNFSNAAFNMVLDF